MVDGGAVGYLAPLIAHDDAKLKRQVCSCLAMVAKHSVDLAEVVVEAEVFPRILNCLKDTDSLVKKNAATCVREVSPSVFLFLIWKGFAMCLSRYK